MEQGVIKVDDFDNSLFGLTATASEEFFNAIFGCCRCHFCTACCRQESCCSVYSFAIIKKTFCNCSMQKSFKSFLFFMFVSGLLFSNCNLTLITLFLHIFSNFTPNQNKDNITKHILFTRAVVTCKHKTIIFNYISITKITVVFFAKHPHLSIANRT